MPAAVRSSFSWRPNAATTPVPGSSSGREPISPAVCSTSVPSSVGSIGPHPPVPYAHAPRVTHGTPSPADNFADGRVQPARVSASPLVTLRDRSGMLSA
jgi:hypothetical protein